LDHNNYYNLHYEKINYKFKNAKAYACSLQLSAVGLDANAQSTYNVNNQTLAFLAANKIHKVGTVGSSAGSKTLYTNVITIGSQQIDCIVKTVSISNGSFSLP
jgi:hypothetical protein